MKNRLSVRFLYTFLLATLIFTSCSNHLDLDPNQYLTQEKQDYFLVNIIKYVGKKPSGVADSLRFSVEYNDYYYNQASQLFKLNALYSRNQKDYYGVLLKKVPSLFENNKRAVGFKFTITKDSLMSDFEELFITPMFTDEEAVEKGRFLLKEVIKKGSLTPYIGNYDYLEFPNKDLIYDTKSKKWIFNKSKQ